jgi:hypothetical protein
MPCPLQTAREGIKMLGINGFGRILILFGIILVAAGILFIFSDKIPWLGRLPGDICIRRQNTVFYFPLGTSILISVILSIILFFLGSRR